MRLNSGESSILHTDSKLMYDEELFRDGVPLSEGMVALERDLQERSLLAELAKGHEPPVVTFTDGPIELWGARDGQEAKAYAESLEKYKGVLSRLQTRGVVTAGYVDKPASDLVVRLLELARATPKDMEDLRNFRPLLGVTDRFLFGDKNDLLLKPGHRSAVFSIQSSSAKNYPGVLSLHFFYLNAGRDAVAPAHCPGRDSALGGRRRVHARSPARRAGGPVPGHGRASVPVPAAPRARDGGRLERGEIPGGADADAGAAPSGRGHGGRLEQTVREGPARQADRGNPCG